MKYDYREGIEKQKSRKWLILPILGLLCGAYFLVNMFSPDILYVIEPTDTTAKKLVSSQPNSDENRLYIPKINADILVVAANGDESLALEKGAVQRSPDSGNPKDGGNFVVVAHRLSLGYTPLQTHEKSSFYHLSKLSEGDDIYVDYSGMRYAYKVEELKAAESDVDEISERSDANTLTLYTVEQSGRQVVVAKLVGKVVWSNGKPKLQALQDS